MRGPEAALNIFLARQKERDFQIARQQALETYAQNYYYRSLIVGEEVVSREDSQKYIIRAIVETDKEHLNRKLRIEYFNPNPDDTKIPATRVVDQSTLYDMYTIKALTSAAMRIIIKTRLQESRKN